MKLKNLFNPAELPATHNCMHNSEYGDAWIVAKYCGFSEVPQPFSGEWQHGWMMPERNIHPEFVIGNDGLSRNRKSKKYLVAREDQVQYLRSEGYSNVTAIGLPIIYATKPKLDRIPRSLLVMPVHSLSDTEEQWNDEEYASHIESISDNFDEIVLCLHSSCLKKGNWINAFKKRNVKVVPGADPNDCNSYLRMAHLFNRFEYVTSNEMGSHIAYAAYMGAKTSIAGPGPRFQKSDYARTEFYTNAPELLDVLDKWYKEGFFKEHFSFLYCEPQNAVTCVEWAQFQLGEIHRKNPKELMEILGWSSSGRALYKIKKVVRKIIS